MTNTNINSSEIEQLKTELFLQPSKTLMTDRFIHSSHSAGAVAARCGGHCSSGTCKAIVK